MGSIAAAEVEEASRWIIPSSDGDEDDVAMAAVVDSRASMAEESCCAVSV